MFRALAEDADFEYAMSDGSIVKVHRHGQGAKGGTQGQAIGRSRGGVTTKILALADAAEATSSTSACCPDMPTTCGARRR